MLKDITLGQFFPGNSVLHKMNPSAKIVSSVLFIVAVFLCSNVFAFGFLVFLTALLVEISGIPFSVIGKTVKPLAFILIFTTAYNIFFGTGETVLFEWKFISITVEGIYTAILIAIRIICLLVGSSVILTYTTSPIELTDGIEELLKPLTLLKIDVHTFAMMMSIALRFIPTLIEETDKIISAQKARGADFESGNIINRTKALVPVLIPLFASSIRHALDLATAMECRCYRGGEGRTKLNRRRITARDVIVLVLFAAVIAAVVVMNRFCPGFGL